MAQDIQTMLDDPRFHGLPAPERIKFLNTVYPEFRSLPDAEKLKFVTSPRLSPKKRPIGATGTFTEPTRTEVALRTALGPFARLGAGVVDAAKATVHMPLDIARAAGQPPQTEREKLAAASAGGLGLLGERLIARPTMESYESAKKATSPWRAAVAGTGMVPLVGPPARHIGERLLSGDIAGAMGEALVLYLLPKTVGEAKTSYLKPLKYPETDTAVTKSSIDDLSSVIRPGVKAVPLQPTALAGQPLLKQVAQEANFNPLLNLAIKRETVPPGDAFGDLYRGGTEAQTRLVSQRLGVEYNPADPTPIPLMFADRAVDIAQRPMDRIVNYFANEDAAAVRDAIVKGLEERASATPDSALKSNYAHLIQEVWAKSPNVAGMNALKVYANKESARLYRMFPGAQIQATATPIQAFKDLGDLVRSNLYPFLQQKGAANLFEFGRQEAVAIAMRDGIYQSWTEAAIRQVADDRQGYLDWVTSGHSDTLRFALTERSAATVGMAGRFFKGKPNPLGDFNKAFRNGIGSTGGFVPHPALSRRPKFWPDPLTGRGERGQLPMGPTPPIEGGPPTYQEPLWREPSVGGPRGPQGPPGEEYRADIRRRQIWREGAEPKPKGQLSLEKGIPPKLFGIEQTPFRWQPAQRETYTLKDLNDMGREIMDYLSKNQPRPKVRQELMSDLIAIRREINRRMAARKAGPSMNF